MKIQVDKQYMLHEGGTKFYQVLRVLVDRRAVTVTNWGSQKGEPGLRRIESHGSLKIDKSDSYRAAIKAKAGRGYKDAIEWGKTNVLDNQDKLREYLIVELGRANAQVCMDHLGFSMTEKVDPSDDADTSSARAAARSVKMPEQPAAASSMEDWGEF